MTAPGSSEPLTACLRNDSRVSSRLMTWSMRSAARGSASARTLAAIFLTSAAALFTAVVWVTTAAVAFSGRPRAAFHAARSRSACSSWVSPATLSTSRARSLTR